MLKPLPRLCESDTFQRGQAAVVAGVCIAMFGNTNQPIDVMVQIGHLFAPMPDLIRDDVALIHRLAFYLPCSEVIDRHFLTGAHLNARGGLCTVLD
jgi:predicted ATP-dependent Lon-type protease